MFGSVWFQLVYRKCTSLEMTPYWEVRATRTRISSRRPESLHQLCTRVRQLGQRFVVTRLELKGAVSLNECIGRASFCLVAIAVTEKFSLGPMTTCVFVCGCPEIVMERSLRWHE